MIITIVGLGLIGGSLAMALQGFHDAHIIGLNRSISAIDSALKANAIDEGYALNDDFDPTILSKSDVVIVCLYPTSSIDFMAKYGQYAKSRSIWTDVAGIKQSMIGQAQKYLPKDVDFVGAHPMAGRELYGFDAALPTLFEGCNYVICPTDKNKVESIEFIEEMALYVGAGKITKATPYHHDKMIAYTSQMAHALAAAIVSCDELLESKGFEGGSFRDLTRVATLNADMWSELFVLNHTALLDVLHGLQKNIDEIISLINPDKQAQLREYLSNANKRKEQWKTWEV